MERKHKNLSNFFCITMGLHTLNLTKTFTILSLGVHLWETLFEVCFSLWNRHFPNIFITIWNNLDFSSIDGIQWHNLEKSFRIINNRRQTSDGVQIHFKNENHFHHFVHLPESIYCWLNLFCNGYICIFLSPSLSLSFFFSFSFYSPSPSLFLFFCISLSLFTSPWVYLFLSFGHSLSKRIDRWGLLTSRKEFALSRFLPLSPPPSLWYSLFQLLAEMLDTVITVLA